MLRSELQARQTAATGRAAMAGRMRGGETGLGNVIANGATFAALDAANGGDASSAVTSVLVGAGTYYSIRGAEKLVSRAARPIVRGIAQAARNRTLLSGALRFGRAALPYARAAGGPLALAAGGAYLAGNAYDAPDAYFAARATGASELDAFGQSAASLVFGNRGATLSRETNAEIRERLLARRNAADMTRREDLKSYVDDLRAERQARMVSMISRFSTPEDEEMAATRSNLRTLERRLGSRADTPDRMSNEERQELEALRGRVNELISERAGMEELQKRQTLADAAERERAFSRRETELSRGRLLSLAEDRITRREQDDELDVRERLVGGMSESRAAAFAVGRRFSRETEFINAQNRAGLLDDLEASRQRNILARESRIDLLDVARQTLPISTQTPAPAYATAAALGPGNIGARTAGLSNTDATLSRNQEETNRLLKDAVSILNKIAQQAAGGGVSFNFP